jgi:predicted nucleic acid-binding protein
MTYVLDTSVLIEVENENKEIIEKINALKDRPAAELSLTIFTFCEFYYGVINKSEKNKEKVLVRLNYYTLLNTTQQAGIIFCDLLSHLARKGQPIPDFDLFIAAIAIASGATLITRARHFKDIPGLKVELL